MRVKYQGRKPFKKHETDAGFDLYANENVVIMPGEVKKVDTGTKLEIEPGYYGQIIDRSSVASLGLKVVAGTIDSGFRDFLKVCLANNLQGGTDQTFQISEGDRIAQIVFLPVPQIEWLESELSQTERGEGGFGSTGK